MQIPIGAEEKFVGVVDLIKMQAYYFDGENGEVVRTEPIPAELLEEATTKRGELIAAAGDFDDEVASLFIEEKPVPTEALIRAVRKGCIDLKITPVFMGSAYKNKGVQSLLDGVCHFLPSPKEVVNEAHDQSKDEEKIVLESRADKPFVGLAFKLEDGRYGQLTYMRIYQGKVSKGDFITNCVNQKSVKVPRLVRMHSDDKHDIEMAEAGDIVALFGVDCASGRHLHRREDQGHHDLDAHSRRGDLARHRAQGEGGCGQLLEGAQPLHPRGSHLPRPPRRGVGADHRERNGRAPP